MNNNLNMNDPLIIQAIEKIKRDSKFKPQCSVIIGPTGPTGPSSGATGPTGPAPTLSIGNVTTGAPGTEAEVIITKA